MAQKAQGRRQLHPLPLSPSALPGWKEVGLPPAAPLSPPLSIVCSDRALGLSHTLLLCGGKNLLAFCKILLVPMAASLEAEQGRQLD